MLPFPRSPADRLDMAECLKWHWMPAFKPLGCFPNASCYPKESFSWTLKGQEGRGNNSLALLVLVSVGIPQKVQGEQSWCQDPIWCRRNCWCFVTCSKTHQLGSAQAAPGPSQKQQHLGSLWEMTQRNPGLCPTWHQFPFRYHHSKCWLRPGQGFLFYSW